MKETKRRRDFRISFVAQCLNKGLVNSENISLANEWFIQYGQVHKAFDLTIFNIIEFSRWLDVEAATKKERRP